MTEIANDAQPIHPPTVTAPREPLPLWRFVPAFIVNPLRTIPERAYHEPIVLATRGPAGLVWVTGPQLVERVLLHDHEKLHKTALERRIFHPIIGDGILTSEGTAWRWQRRTAAALFRHAELLGYVPAIAEAGERLLERWSMVRGETRRAIDRDMTDVTFDALASTIFAGASESEGTLIKHEGGAYLGNTSWELVWGLLKLPERVWHPRKAALRRSAARLRACVLTLLERERAKGWPSGGLLARLGAARDPETGAPMSDANMVDNLLTFAAAGHETTAKALTWTLYLLARAPHWQQRMRQEVREVCGTAPVSAEHVELLVVTRRVLKEGMRLYPPAPVMSRAVADDVELGGHRLRAGTLLIIPIFAIHRHRSLWRDPDSFDPERFSAAHESAMARTQYMPFGFGPRTCIGMSFAMIEATVLLATLVRRARFACDAQHRPEPISRVTLRPRGGMPLAVTRID